LDCSILRSTLHKQGIPLHQGKGGTNRKELIMKRITFAKACRIDPKYPQRLIRPNFPGYLLTHPNHPRHEFVIARGSFVTNPSGSTWKFSKVWHLYDRKRGLEINSNGNHKTRAERVESAIEFLTLTTPENIEAIIETTLAKRFGAIMSL
jgi:hypothetical protein